MNIKVWTSEEKVSGCISTAVVSALANFTGRLLEIEGKFCNYPGHDFFSQRSELRREIEVLQRLTLSVVAGSIVGAVEDVKARLERFEAEGSFAEHGSASLLSCFRWDTPEAEGRFAHLWVRSAASGVELRIEDRIGGVREVVCCAADFDAGYAYMEKHREGLMEKLRLLLSDELTAAEGSAEA